MGQVIVARGHPRITAKHQKTFMITKERSVGPRGDCIIAVDADKAVSDLAPEIKRAIRAGCELVITITAGGIGEKIHAKGHPSLPLDHPTDLVVRKSGFICGRTLAIGADKAAVGLSRKLVDVLQNPLTKLELKIEVIASRRAA